jgi:hypothetical protein
MNRTEILNMMYHSTRLKSFSVTRCVNGARVVGVWFVHMHILYAHYYEILIWLTIDYALPVMYYLESIDKIAFRKGLDDNKLL